MRAFARLLVWQIVIAAWLYALHWSRKAGT